MALPATTTSIDVIGKSADQLTQFRLFPELPPELRLKIWHLALPGPRVVEFERPLSWTHQIRGLPWLVWYPVQHSCQPKSPLSAVNREARDVFYAEYLPVTKAEFLSALPMSIGDGLFNVRQDTLFLSGASNNDYMQPWKQRSSSSCSNDDLVALFKKDLTEAFGWHLVANLRFLAMGCARTLVLLNLARDMRRTQPVNCPDHLSAFISNFLALEEIFIIMKDNEDSLAGIHLPKAAVTFVDLSAKEDEDRQRDLAKYIAQGTTLSYAHLPGILSEHLQAFYQELPNRKVPKISLKRSRRGGKTVEDMKSIQIVVADE